MSATLEDIRIKIRRVTKSPSINQITDSQIDSYINNFILYDFPEHLRLFNLRTHYEFTAKPNVPTYEFDKQTYLTIHPPLYIAGYESYYTQSETEFYRLYPLLRSITALDVGDGSAGPFSGTLQAFPALQNYILIDTMSTTNLPLTATDVPSDPFNGTGTFTGDATGNINYLTGAITNLTFTSNVLNNEPINVQAVNYVAQRPTAALFYHDQIVLRPVPDQSYQVRIEAYKRPTALINAGDIPELEEWWQYIAMGASLKIFEDRGDLESYQKFYPLYDQYQRLVQRRTIVQYTNDRTATIYTEMVQGPGFGNLYGRF